MATQRDRFSAEVTVEGTQAKTELSTLAKKAKETSKALGETGKTGKTSSATLTQGLVSSTVAGKGLAASLKSQVGALGAIGVAAGAFTAIGGAVAEVSKAQTRLNEAANASRVTFGEASKGVADFAARAASGLGLSKRAAFEATTGFGLLLQAVGFTNKASADFSKSLTRLSADLASLIGGTVEDAALALRALFRGEGDPIEKYGVKIQEAETKTQALRLGLSGANGELSNQAKTMARLSLVYVQTAKAQGDFSRTQAELANQQRIFAAQTEDAKASLGGLVNPTVNATLSGFNVTLGKANAILEGHEKSLGDAVKEGSKFIPIIGNAIGVLDGVGKAGKKAGDGMGDFNDILRIAAQEQVNNRTGSALYKEAITALKVEFDKATASEQGRAAAMKDAGLGTVLVRQESDAARASIQGLISAQRGAEDASLRVASSQRKLAIEQKSLAEIMRVGKVDAEKVAAAQTSLREANDRVADATQRVRDAQRALNDLLKTGAVDAEKVAEAARSVVSAHRDEASAAKSVADAERDLARLRDEIASGRGATDAERGLARARIAKKEAEERVRDASKALSRARGADRAAAQLDLESATLDLADATDALADAEKRLANLSSESSEALAEAERRVADARLSAEDATARRAKAEADERLARAGDPEFEEKLASRRRDLAVAEREAAQATEDRGKKDAELRKARAGDPDFETKVAEAKERIAEAERDIARGLVDARLAVENARSKQEEFNDSLRAGTTLAAALIGLLSSLGLGPSLGLPTGGGGTHNLIPRANGGPVTAGSAYVVGERRPELFIPNTSGRIVPNVSSSGNQPVHVTLLLDGQVLTEVVTNRQEADARTGGSRRGR